MPKNVQITVQLHSFHMLARLCSKSLKLGFSSMWTKNFQMYKLDSEKADQIANIHWIIDKAREFKKISASLTTLKPLTVDHNKLENSSRDGNTRPPYLPLRNLYACQEATVRTWHGIMNRFKTGKGLRQDCILSPCLFNVYEEYIMQNVGLIDSQAGIKIA